MEKRVLVADVPQLGARLAVVLAGRDAVFVHTLADALKALAVHDFDLVLIGMHFDDSRMFELLQELRAGGRNRDVAVLCYRLRPLAFAALGAAALDAAVKALEARGFVDLAMHVEEEAANGELARLVESLTGSG
jgi:PleD family two-component response regulator